MALDFFAGCVGGLCGVVVGHPLDTVKVRIQTQSAENLRYRGTFHCFASIVKEETAFGLYKGITSPLAGVAAVNAMIFGVYGMLRPYVAGSPGNDTLFAHFCAGSIAGSVQTVVTSPMELIKTRLQISESKNASAWKVAKDIYLKEGGLRKGIFKGWAITLGREAPAFGTYFATYEALTSKCGRDVGTLWMMAAGGFAGVASWLICFPFDVIKTKLQSDTSGKYKNAMDCLVKTYKNEKSAFFRGLNSTLIRAFPTNAATFTVVTWIMRFHEKMQLDKSGDESSEKSPFEIWSDWEKVKKARDIFIPIHHYNYLQPPKSSQSSPSMSGHFFFKGDKIFAYNHLVQNVEAEKPQSQPLSLVSSIPSLSKGVEEEEEMEKETKDSSFKSDKDKAEGLKLNSGSTENQAQQQQTKETYTTPEIFVLSEVLDLPYIFSNSRNSAGHINPSAIIRDYLQKAYSRSKSLCKCLDQLDVCVCFC